MNQTLVLRRLLAPALVLSLWIGFAHAHADSAAVRAVLFYSPSCGHCHQVITEDLPPLFEKYGDQLQIIGVNVAEEAGGALFNAAGERFGIPPENRGVPFLVVGEVVLIGSLDIPEQLPVLIEKYLAEGGVDWPDIPGLAATLAQANAGQATSTPALAAQTTPASFEAPTQLPTFTPTYTRQPTTTPAPGLLLTGSSSGGLGARFDRDPVGNGLAVAVLVAMLAALAWALARRPWRLWHTELVGFRSGRDWAIPLLCVAGLGIAGYLAYVETQQVQAVCGPVGDCNSVQQSPYARLFGLLPIGVLGVAGYLGVLAIWAAKQVGSGSVRLWAAITLQAAVTGGVLFSIYLTFLEPFVIGATCAWCLSSAVIMTLLLVLAVQRPSGERRVRAWEVEGTPPAQ